MRSYKQKEGRSAECRPSQRGLPGHLRRSKEVAFPLHPEGRSVPFPYIQMEGPSADLHNGPCLSLIREGSSPYTQKEVSSANICESSCPSQYLYIGLGTVRVLHLEPKKGLYSSLILQKKVPVLLLYRKHRKG